jgi:hypothetical protein
MASRSALLGIALTLSACALFALLDSATKYAGLMCPCCWCCGCAFWRRRW